MARTRNTKPEVTLPENFAANERDMAEAWLKYTLEKFRASITRLKIGSTGELMNSLRGELLSAAGGDELKIRITYAIQGMFVDMGVGRGMGAGITKAAGPDFYKLRNGRGQLLRHQRKAKRWYAQNMARESKRLAELSSELWGLTLIASVATALPAEPVDINF